MLGVTAAAAAVVLLLVYLRWLRPWHLRWGATDTEVKRSMPGDEIVVHPSFNATRAVTVDAPAEAIWPWLVQIGLRRAGWYSYDVIDNLGVPSARRIIPELQHLAVGDFIPISPIGEIGFWVRDMERDRFMLWADRTQDTSWLWALYPDVAGGTRLITRVRMRYNWRSLTILFDLLLDVGDIVMMRRSLLGINWRAESLARVNAAK